MKNQSYTPRKSFVILNPDGYKFMTNGHNVSACQPFPDSNNVLAGNLSLDHRISVPGFDKGVQSRQPKAFLFWAQ